MKRHAIYFKNIAAFLMLFAMLSLLLPFVKIETPAATSSVSGLEIAKITAKTGIEYIKNDTIKNSFVIKDSLTWGALKEGANYAAAHNAMPKIMIGVAICILPIILCFLAMMFTFLASGKTTMILPTLFMIVTVAENLFIIAGASTIQKMILEETGGNGIAVTLLIGIYAFTILCAIALGIILFLWFTGGFNRPERRRDRRRYNDSDDDDDKDKKKKKSRFFRKDKRDKKRRKKRKSRRKKNKRSKNSSSKQDSKEQPKKEEAKSQVEAASVGAVGHVTGLSGLYEGVDMDLTKSGDGIFTIGTTEEARDILLHGNRAEAYKLDGHNCVINYSAANRQYMITSHSLTDILLRAENESSQVIRLGNGDWKTVGANTILYIGDYNNSIRLN